MLFFLGWKYEEYLLKQVKFKNKTWSWSFDHIKHLLLADDYLARCFEKCLKLYLMKLKKTFYKLNQSWCTYKINKSSKYRLGILDKFNHMLLNSIWRLDYFITNIYLISNETRALNLWEFFFLLTFQNLWKTSCLGQIK